MSAEERLEANMYQAYLAHRLLEELNDVLSANYNCPVIPVNMTRSNLIVHHIIGEPFANQIDGAIQAVIINDKSGVKLFAYPQRYRASLFDESSNIRCCLKVRILGSAALVVSACGKILSRLSPTTTEPWIQNLL